MIEETEQDRVKRYGSLAFNDPSHPFQHRFRLNRMKKDSENRLRLELTNLEKDYSSGRITHQELASKSQEIKGRRDRIEASHQKRIAKNDVEVNQRNLFIEAREAFLTIYGSDENGYIIEDYALFFAEKFSVEEFVEFSETIEEMANKEANQNSQLKDVLREKMVKVLCKQIMFSWLTKEIDSVDFEKLPVEWKIDLLLNNTNTKYDDILNSVYKENATILRLMEKSHAKGRRKK